MHINSDSSSTPIFQILNQDRQSPASKDKTDQACSDLAAQVQGQEDSGETQTSFFTVGRTLSEEEQRRLMELQQELTAMLGENPEEMTEERQRRIREIEQEMADITGVQMPAKGRVAQVAKWLEKDETGQEKQARENRLTDGQLLNMQSDDVRQWQLNRLSLGIEPPETGEGLLSFIQQNAALAYSRQSSMSSPSVNGKGAFSGT